MNAPLPSGHHATYAEGPAGRFDLLTPIARGPVFGQNPAQVIKAFCRVTGVTEEALAGPERTRAVTRLRHELMWLLRTMTSISHSAAGGWLGGRDLSTVQAGVNGVSDQMARDPEYRQRMRFLVEQVGRLVTMPPAAVTPSGAEASVRVLAARAVLDDRKLSDADARQAALVLLREAE